MHIWIVNISEMVIDIVKILLLSNSKLYMGIRLGYLLLTLTHSKYQDQGHAHFYSEYLENGEKQGKKYNCRQIASHVWTCIQLAY